MESTNTNDVQENHPYIQPKEQINDTCKNTKSQSYSFSAGMMARIATTLLLVVCVLTLLMNAENSTSTQETSTLRENSHVENDIPNSNITKHTTEKSYLRTDNVTTSDAYVSQTTKKTEFIQTSPTEVFGGLHALEELHNTTARILATTYYPGNLIVNENGIVLSQGLTSKIIARKGQRVKYESGESKENFHTFPDGAATYTDDNPSNKGGWIYVSNSETRDTHEGGVGAIKFNKNGKVIEYKMILTGTRANCGGGRTPWKTWISCEEYGRGNIWQVDPTGARKAVRITMGDKNPGPFEAFAYDDRNKDVPRFFTTKDEEKGEITRFTPTKPDWKNPWDILTGTGTMEYLVIHSSGKFEWTTDHNRGRDSAKSQFPFVEGIDRKGSELYFIAKKMSMLFILNLDNLTWKKFSTKSGLFGDGSDQIQFMVGSNTEFMYFTEDGEKKCGVHGRNKDGKFFTILESSTISKETTGLSFSPDKKHMYIAFQHDGILFDITRTDGLTFDGENVGIKYHR